MEVLESEYDSDGEAMLHPTPRKKRKPGKSNWKSEAERRTKREDHNIGCVLKCKHQINDKSGCNVRAIHLADLYEFNKKFWRISNAIDQRKFIQRCISMSCIQRTVVEDLQRKRKQRNHTINCFIQTKNQRVQVCKEALLGILSIGQSKLEFTANCLLEDDEALKEKRGGSSPKLAELENEILEHIKRNLNGLEDIPSASELPVEHVNNETQDRGEEVMLPNNTTARKRKRKADPKLWKVNERSQKRSLGQEYTDRNGRVRQQKEHKTITCECRFSCSTYIKPEQQASLFKDFYSLGDPTRQKSFLSGFVQQQEVQRHRKRDLESDKIKKVSRFYYLPVGDGTNARVCLKFLCGLFQFSYKVIDLMLRDTSSTGVYLGVDHRLSKQGRKTRSDAIDIVKTHINLFPKMESHYCRKSSRKLYLSPELSVAELFRLYEEYCDKKSIPAELRVKIHVYRDTFNTFDPPLSMYVPKKDRCTKCKVYNEAPPSQKEKLQEAYTLHKKREYEALDAKKNDMASKLENQRTIVFDLEAVLSVPFAGDLEIYYRRKLSIYNFTIFDSMRDGYCFLWDEVNGRKGSNEIGTCIYSYITILPYTVNHIITYSDTYAGQNRNQFIAALMIFIVLTSDSIEIIDMKYMESGHSYLEADSMHSCIERNRRHRQLYTTGEYGTVMESARKTNPYKVKIVSFSEFYGLKDLNSKYLRLATKCWLNVKHMRFTKESPYIIKFKENLGDSEFRQLNVLQKGRGRRGGQSHPPLNSNYSLKHAYREKLPISMAKKKDLTYILQEGVIPSYYADFYGSLPFFKTVKDVSAFVVDDDEKEEDFIITELDVD